MVVIANDMANSLASASQRTYFRERGARANQNAAFALLTNQNAAFDLLTNQNAAFPLSKKQNAYT